MNGPEHMSFSLASRREMRHIDNEMTPNPYEPPRPYSPEQNPQAYYPQSAVVTTVDRTPFVLAAVGAWLAGAYWAALTLLILVGASSGNGSMTSVIMPFILIFLYAARGFNLFKGDPKAAQTILWLHGFGIFAAISQMASGGGIIVALQSVKILIHVFGGVTALLALRAVKEAIARQAASTRGL
jgi:hypothetical protein